MWKDGYWHGPMRDGYPVTFFGGEDGNRFQFPWEKWSDLSIVPEKPSDHQKETDNDRSEACCETAGND
jgi:hypothetical protein